MHLSSEIGLGDGGDLEVKEEGTSEKHVEPNVRMLKLIIVARKKFMISSTPKEE